jgi:HAD superfamily hydrolase (TIGR01509 family)
MIKALIFDCFGVLTTDSWRAFLDGLPPEADRQRARELNHQYDAGLISREEFLGQVEEATGGRPVEVERLLDNEVVKNKQLLDYIRRLKKDHKIGLLSNIATNWIRDQFLEEAEQELFDEMILSFEVGMTKPDPRIFMLACERLRVGTHEAVLIDDIESYCEAARQEGLKAVVYRDFDQLKAELEPLLAHK